MRIEAALKRDPECAVAGRTINGSNDDLYAETTQSIVETLVASDAMPRDICATLPPTTWFSRPLRCARLAPWTAPGELREANIGTSARAGVEQVSGYRMNRPRKCFTTIA